MSSLLILGAWSMHNLPRNLSTVALSFGIIRTQVRARISIYVSSTTLSCHALHLFSFCIDAIKNSLVVLNYSREVSFVVPGQGKI